MFLLHIYFVFVSCLLTFGTDCVPRVRLKIAFLNEHYNYYFRLVDSPSEVLTSPNQILQFTSFIELEEVGFIEDATHQFEDPYLIDTQALKLVQEFQGTVIGHFQHCPWLSLYWMQFLVVFIMR